MKHTKLVVFLLSLIVIGMTLSIFFDRGAIPTEEQLLSSREQFKTWYESHPALFVGGYSALYIVVTALSLPFATLLTLLAGFLFGLGLGTLIVSFASTLGATLAFLTSRLLLRSWVESKLKNRLGTLNDGITKEGAFYLFTLRMLPIVPFFVINLGMGLTSIRTWTFYWVSQVGMLFATVLYVNAGAKLGEVSSFNAKEILTPKLLIAFALLGIAPLITKKILGHIRQSKIKDLHGKV